MSNKETYIGDGVYARFNGQEVWLRADDQEICLDTGMLKQIQSMVDSYEPPEPDGECFRGTEYASALAHEQAQAQRLKR